MYTHASTVGSLGRDAGSRRAHVLPCVLIALLACWQLPDQASACGPCFGDSCGECADCDEVSGDCIPNGHSCCPCRYWGPYRYADVCVYPDLTWLGDVVRVHVVGSSMVPGVCYQLGVGFDSRFVAHDRPCPLEYPEQIVVPSMEQIVTGPGGACGMPAYGDDTWGYVYLPGSYDFYVQTMQSGMQIVSSGAGGGRFFVAARLDLEGPYSLGHPTNTDSERCEHPDDSPCQPGDPAVFYIGVNDDFDEGKETEDAEDVSIIGTDSWPQLNDLAQMPWSISGIGNSEPWEATWDGDHDVMCGDSFADRASAKMTVSPSEIVRLWVWRNNQYEQLPLGQNIIPDYGTDSSFYAEGLKPGTVTIQLEGKIDNDNDLRRIDKIRLSTVKIDVDVDSDNTNTTAPFGPDAPPATPPAANVEDRIEQKAGEPGRFVLVNDDDDDQDGIPDYDDGYNANNDPIQGNYDEDDITYQDQMHKENDFVMLKVKIAPSTIDLDTNKAWVKVSYLDASPDPNVASQPTDPFEFPGRIRLWKRPGDEPRDGRPALLLYANQQSQGDWIAPGEYTDLRLLMPDYATPTHEMTLYIEGVEESRWFGGVKITFELDPDGEGPAPYVHMDTVQVTVATLNLSITGVTEAEEETRGGVITLNNDNDDFNPPGPHNYDPDWQQNGTVLGENDLQQITLDTSLTCATSLGQLRLEISAGTTGNNPNDTNVKVWTDQTKGTLVLDGANKARNWTMAEFIALRPGPGQPVPLWVEGFKRSGSVKDVELRFSYRGDPAPQTPSLQDNVRYTVVQLMLDVDRDSAPTDDNPSYLPGYDVGAPPSPVLSPTQAYQEMQLLALPITIGTTTDRLTDTARFEIVETTHIPGWCMNQGHQNGGDYSLAQAGNTYLNDVGGNTGIHVAQPFYCKDDGGRCTVQLKLLRNNVQLTVCELRVPLDTDRDWLPDSWETDYSRDSSPAQNVVFDPRNPETTGAGHVDRHYDLDFLPVTPGAIAAIDRNPQDGRQGDGLTAFEEYRGFVYRDIDENNPRHYRLDPHRKDVFAVSEVVDNLPGPNVDMQLGELPTALPDLLAHRLHQNAAFEEFVLASRVVNYNRSTEADAYPAGWPQDQKCLRFVVDNTLGAGVLGLTAGPAINTGPDGVCQTQARAGDAQPILLGQGLADAVAIRPGPNGIIDPPYDAANDVLNVAAMQVQMGADGQLTSLNPLGDDRVRGRIRGTDGVLQQATVAAMIAADVLVGEIQEGPDSYLEPATVEGVTGDDSLASVVIAAGLDGFLQTQAAGDDLLDPIGQTISPGLNGVFDSVMNASDEYQGSIQSGPDGILQSRPANANDVVVGTIEEGTDSNLQSRPAHPDDYVEGYMDPGPDAVFDPRGNDDRTSNVRPLSPPQRAADDGFDRDNMTITAGADGLLSTTASGDDELAFPVGQGQPYSECVTNNGAVNAIPNTRADTSPTGGDDRWAGGGPGGGTGTVNESPNEHMLIRINVLEFQNFFGTVFGPNGIDEGGPPHGDDVDVDLRVNVASRRSWIRKTITHEGGHGMHCEHYRPLPANSPPNLAGEVTYSHNNTLFPGRNGAGSPTNTDYVRSGIWQVVAPGGQYDDVTRDQIRVHIKHNP